MFEQIPDCLLSINKLSDEFMRGCKNKDKSEAVEQRDLSLFLKSKNYSCSLCCRTALM